jgi:pSer/pThr/pTyr-binding forkhead associated (FHA) protein
MRFLPVCFFAAAISSASSLLCSPGAPGALAQESVWGYLYFPRTQRLFPLVLEENGIGRLTENVVVLSSPRVSRRHAVIKKSGETIELVDVGSSNGTRHNGAPLLGRAGTPLSPGDRVEFADELALFHLALSDLWRDELRHRLLAGIIKLHQPLPQDQTRKAFGREEIEPAITEATVDAESGAVEVEHSIPLDSGGGFPEGGAAFIGGCDVEGGVLELSLWTIAAGESMTSRRASFTNLKHATLRVTIPGGPEKDAGPWFPSHLLGGLFDVFPDEPEFSLQFAVSLAGQQRPKALSDAAATLSFRHRLNPTEWKLILMAAQAKGLWIDKEIGERGLSLGADEKIRLSEALEEARAWLEQAKALGAKGDPGKEAEDALTRASERLSRIQASPP